MVVGLYWGLPLTGRVLEINAETAKSGLSTIIQSQVSIIAIVISISLVVFELSITKYGKELFEIFKRHPALWYLLFSYISSIILNSCILFSIIEDGQIEISSLFKVCLIYYSVCLFFMLLLVLIPHFLATMNQLHTERVFSNLLEHINIQKLTSLDNPFQVIFPHIYSSIEKNDFPTMITLISRIKTKYFEIMNYESPSLNKKYISSRFFDDIIRAIVLLFEKNEIRSIIDIFGIIKEICDESLEHNISLSFTHAVHSFGEIGVKAVIFQNKLISSECMLILFEYYQKAKVHNIFGSDLSFFSQSFYDIGDAALSQKDFLFASHFFDQIKKIIKDNIEINEYVVNNAIFLYGQLINKSVKEGNQQFFNESITFLEEINTIALAKNFKGIAFISESELNSIKAIKEYYVPSVNNDQVGYQ